MEDLTEKIIQFVKNYFEAYFTERDLDKTKKFLSSQMTVVGTGFHEIGTNMDETVSLFKKDLEEVQNPITYSDLEINVHVQTPDISIAFGSLSIEGNANGISFSIPNLRYSYTIIKKNRVLKIIVVR